MKKKLISLSFVCIVTVVLIDYLYSGSSSNLKVSLSTYSEAIPMCPDPQNDFRVMSEGKTILNEINPGTYSLSSKVYAHIYKNRDVCMCTQNLEYQPSTVYYTNGSLSASGLIEWKNEWTHPDMIKERNSFNVHVIDSRPNTFLTLKRDAQHLPLSLKLNPNGCGEWETILRNISDTVDETICNCQHRAD